MQKRGYLRLFTVIFICAFVIIYNVKEIKNINFAVAEKNQINTLQTEKENIENIVLKEEKMQEKEKDVKTENSESKETESVESEKTVSASAGAAKGKIIEKYISPYSTSLSYDKVYIKNSTELDINIKSLIEAPLKFKIENSSSPQVLIMHTHATETFMQTNRDYYTDNDVSRTRDNQKNMVKIGETVAKKLNEAGIVTLHDATQHDYPNYTGSYSRAAKTINSYLAKYPSIKIVLDLHRDAVSSGENDKVKLTTEINGKKAAQVMLVMGSQSGSVTNFPEWKENLKLAVKLQRTLEEKYPSLARPIMLMPKNYNESLTTGSLLLEFGTEANTLDEALYSADMVGESLIELINNLKE